MADDAPPATVPAGRRAFGAGIADLAAACGFNGDKVSEVAGNLTLLGKTNPVVLKATNFNCYVNPMLKVEVCGGDFETTLVRSQYGMGWGLNFGFSDNVRLVVQVEAVKQ